MPDPSKGSIQIRFVGDEAPRVSLQGAVPDGTKQHVQDLMGWGADGTDNGAPELTEDMGGEYSNPEPGEVPQGSQVPPHEARALGALGVHEDSGLAGAPVTVPEPEISGMTNTRMPNPRALYGDTSVPRGAMTSQQVKPPGETVPLLDIVDGLYSSENEPEGPDLPEDGEMEPVEEDPMVESAPPVTVDDLSEGDPTVPPGPADVAPPDMGAELGTDDAIPEDPELMGGVSEAPDSMGGAGVPQMEERGMDPGMEEKTEDIPGEEPMVVPGEEGAVMEEAPMPPEGSESEDLGADMGMAPGAEMAPEMGAELPMEEGAPGAEMAPEAGPLAIGMAPEPGMEMGTEMPPEPGMEPGMGAVPEMDTELGGMPGEAGIPTDEPVDEILPAAGIAEDMPPMDGGIVPGEMPGAPGGSLVTPPDLGGLLNTQPPPGGPQPHQGPPELPGGGITPDFQQTPEGPFVPPPKGVPDNMWNALSHEEQTIYHGTLAEMNEAIDEHNHPKLRAIVQKLARLQDKMKAAPPPMPIMPPMDAPPEELAQQAQDPGGLPGMEAPGMMPPEEELPPMPMPNQTGMPDGTDAPKVPPSTFKSFGMSIRPWYEYTYDFLDKSAKAPHVASGGGGGGNFKYISKEWTGARWDYKYAKEAHASEDRHGVGENAANAASSAKRDRKGGRDSSHTIKKPDAIPEGLDAQQAYHAAIDHHRTNSPERITWTKQGTDGKVHVYRQNSARQSEVSHAAMDEHPASLAKPGKLKRISLSGYDRKHKPRHEGGDESTHRVVETLRDEDGGVLAEVIHAPHKKGRKFEVHGALGKLMASGRSTFARFESKEGAKGAVVRMKAYQKALRSPGKTAKVFEGVLGGEKPLGKPENKVSHRLMSGDVEYKAREVVDKHGRTYRVLTPLLSLAEQRQLFKVELRGVLDKAVNNAINRWGGGAYVSQQQRIGLINSAATGAWLAIMVRQGSGHTGGFVPGPEANLRNMIASVLNSPSSTLKEMFYQEGGSGRSKVSAQDWKDNFRQDWIEDQTTRFIAFSERATSEDELTAKLGELTDKLESVGNRAQAMEFARSHVWASKPVQFEGGREVSVDFGGEDSDRAGSEDMSIDEYGGGYDEDDDGNHWLDRAGMLTRSLNPNSLSPHWSHQDVGTALKSIAHDMSVAKDGSIYDRRLSLLHSFIDTMAKGGNVVKSLQDRTTELYPELPPKVRSVLMAKSVFAFVAHPQVRRIRDGLAELILEEIPRDVPPDLVKAHPAYARASRVVEDRKRARLMRHVLDRVAPENNAKRSVLSGIVEGLHKGLNQKTLVQEHGAKIAKHLGVKPGELSARDCQTQIGLWYEELREDKIFKGFVLGSISRRMSDLQEKTDKAARRTWVSAFDDAATGE